MSGRRNNDYSTFFLAREKEVSVVYNIFQDSLSV